MAVELKDINKKDMGIRIKSRRESLKMSRAELAERVSITPKTVENIECGEKGTSLKTLYKIKHVLGVSIDYLLEGEDLFSGEDEKRKMISENIMSSLSVCSIRQLSCMEQMARLYIEGVVNEE